MSWRKGKRPVLRIWRVVRLKALDRDNWTCRKCGGRGRLEVDHIQPLEDGGELYDLSNLMSLCKKCHISKTRLDYRARHPVEPGVTAWRELVAKRLATGV